MHTPTAQRNGVKKNKEAKECNEEGGRGKKKILSKKGKK